jgi:cobalt transporter subunit CbtB
MTARLISSASAGILSERMKAAVAAVLLGVFFVWGAGLASADVLHDAAHDTRHSFGFPCH